MPRGWDNCCETEIYIGDVAILETKSEVIHAESNCISKLAKCHESGNGAVMFCTHSPCIDCAKLIYQTGISHVYYGELYRSSAGIDFLLQCGVPTTQIQN